jgi:hypothetical protein
MAALGAYVDKDIGHHESCARELDVTECQARPNEFFAAATGVGDVIADFGMGKHGFFSAMVGRRGRVVGDPYGGCHHEDSLCPRYY